MSKVIESIYTAWTARENCIIANNTEWIKKWGDKLKNIEKNYLPYGSGFDNGTKIQSVSETKIVLKSSYHLMDDNGYYREWIDFLVIVSPGFTGIQIELKGQFSALKKKSYGYGIDDYIGDVFYDHLTQEEK